MWNRNWGCGREGVGAVDRLTASTGCAGLDDRRASSGSPQLATSRAATSWFFGASGHAIERGAFDLH